MKKIIYILIAVSIIFAAMTVSIAQAQAPAPEVKTVWTKEDVVALIHEKAIQYKVSESDMNGVVKCESSYVRRAIGDGGNSHGLVQIHAPSHPDITLEMAHDPVFAIDFLAQELSTGNGKIWTCYRKIKGI